MPRTKEQPIPRSIVVTKDMMQPTLAEAFTRWKELGEYPADAMLCTLVPSWGRVDSRGAESAVRNVHTGETFDGETLETLTHVQVKGAVPSQRYYMILRKCD